MATGTIKNVLQSGMNSISAGSFNTLEDALKGAIDSVWNKDIGFYFVNTIHSGSSVFGGILYKQISGRVFGIMFPQAESVDEGIYIISRSSSVYILKKSSIAPL